MWLDDNTRQQLDRDFVEKYNESTKNIPLIVAVYGNTDISKNGLFGIALGGLISISSILLDSVLAIKICFAIKVHNISANVKKLHRILLITLIAQTMIPAVFTFIPCCVCWYTPLFNLEWSYYINSIFVPMISAYPLIDPIVITFALGDYRQAVFKVFRKKTVINPSTFIETTHT
ncbi:unnamed protein product [Caenorhabditis angaria]|uniref:7TM GPCR serpentine receptor class x (Srx) domain-containing protein n=1 Tax=Caenorhabditis angaria TaxID=860376 RepID=A0A9P1J3Y4_9PELO|nr:unnamed protein product [Caenorhabditis angaria]